MDMLNFQLKFLNLWMFCALLRGFEAGSCDLRRDENAFAKETLM